MISVVDYGLGNVQAFLNLYKRMNIPSAAAKAPADVLAAQRLILPGVGAFDWAMSRLNESGLRVALEQAVLGRGVPLLGVCVGMQILAKGSEEGSLPGLGWMDAEVKRFRPSPPAGPLQLPHMGWNDVEPRNGSGLFQDLEADARFYFLHSYYFVPRNPEEILAVTDYGGPFASSVGSGNVFGVQFHPEKSHQWGIQLLKNFAEM